MDILLEAFRRDKSVKAKKLLKEGFVPGCLYGKEVGTIGLKVPLNKLTKIFQNHARKINLKLDGKTWLVGVGEVQREAVSRRPCHVSFVNLDKNQESVFEVEVCLTGRPKEGMVAHLLHTVEIKGRPDQIPDRLEMDVVGLGIGDVLRISDLAKQYPFEIIPSPSDIIVKCRHLQVLESADGPEKVPEPSSGDVQDSATTAPELEEEEDKAA